MQFSVASQIIHEARSLCCGYPDFVIERHNSLISGHVPVFCYHTVKPTRFEHDLQHLAENGYRAIGIDELYSIMKNDRSLPDRSIVLTFDDARSSFWRYAYPLLRRYQMKGVLYVISGLTMEARQARDNLFTQWSGGCTKAQLTAQDPEDSTLCTWPELREMHASGVVEIESHSLFHREVFVDTRPIGHLGPGSNFVPFKSPLTAYLSTSDVGKTISPDAFYGLPLFPSAPLHQGMPAWEVPREICDELRQAWIKAYRNRDGDTISNDSLKRSWRALRLKERLHKQTKAKMEKDISDDITIARDLIRQKIDTAAGNHFCLPFSVGSGITLRILKSAGVKTCAWGTLSKKQYNRPGEDPLRLCRLKSDLLWRLPGNGRSSLLGVYAAKLSRRLRGEPVY